MTRHTPYAAHDAFVAPARAKPQIWRLAVGAFVAIMVYVFLGQVYFVTVGILSGNTPAFAQALAQGNTPVAMYVLLLSFGFMAVGVWVAVKALHQRSFASLLGPIPHLIRDFRAVSVTVLAVILSVIILPPWDMRAAYVPNVPLGQWIVLLGPSLIFILIQVSAEEIVFRGYLQQQLAARFAHPVMWMVLPNLVFAFGHYLPQSSGENAIFIALWSGVFGMLMADLTARSGSLGPAIAVHFWNNVSAMMFLSAPDQFSGLSLYTTPFALSDAAALRAWLPVEFAMMFVLWLAARLALRR